MKYSQGREECSHINYNDLDGALRANLDCSRIWQLKSKGLAKSSVKIISNDKTSEKQLKQTLLCWRKNVYLNFLSKPPKANC